MMASKIGRKLLEVAVVKRTTGVTGLDVNPDAVSLLKSIYGATLEQLGKLPKSAVYRQHTEGLTRDRMAIVADTGDIAQMEEKLGCGQLEEAILVAEKELSLAQKMEDWKPWEPLMRQAPASQWKWP